MWAESEVASPDTAEIKAAWIMYWFLPRSCNEDGEHIDKPANGRADIPQLLPLFGFCLAPWEDAQPWEPKPLKRSVSYSFQQEWPIMCSM